MVTSLDSSVLLASEDLGFARFTVGRSGSEKLNSYKLNFKNNFMHLKKL